MRLTLDILKRLNDFGFIEEITGEYTGTLTGMGASHESRCSYVLMIHYSLKSSSTGLSLSLNSSSSMCMMLDVVWLPPQMKFGAMYGYLVIA